MTNPCELNDCTPQEDINRFGCMKLLIPLLLALLLLLLWLNPGCMDRGGAVVDPTATPTEVVEEATDTPAPTAEPTVAPTGEPTAMSEVVYEAPSLELPSGDIDPANILLTGIGTAGTTVEIFRNGVSLGTTTVADDGTWEFTASTDEYENEFLAVGIDPDGNTIGDLGPKSLLASAALAPLVLDTPQFGAFSLDGDNSSSELNLTGTGQPGSVVQIWIDGDQIGTAEIDADGNWSFTDTIALAPGTYELYGRMATLEGTLQDESDRTPITIPQIGGLSWLMPPQVAQFGTVDDSVTLNIAGTGEPGATVEIYDGDTLIGTTTVDDDGNWSFSVDTVRSAEHDLSAIMLDADGNELDITDNFAFSVGDLFGGVQLTYAGEEGAVEGALAGAPAVSLILDASWSMVRDTFADGTLRIDVAKEALTEVVENIMPEGSPTSLRAFGNREGDLACRTDLEVPLGPLDKEGMIATINGIEPQFNANTALAESLRLTADDLAGAVGPRTVVLLTDGKETCGGDPGAEIDSLVASGVDVEVNIVGLAIDDAALRENFEDWAARSGGRYYDAADVDSLTDAMAEALLVSYEVANADGDVVGRGFVGSNPVTLPSGEYTVTVRSGQSYDVTVESGSVSQVPLE